MSRFKITELKVLSSWRHELPSNTECTICRCSLNEPSLNYQSKGIKSYVIEGECSHAFHQECIDSWVALTKENKRCPICFQPWVPKKSS